MNHQLTWEQLQPTVENLRCEIDGTEYNVWGTQEELDWLENAWSIFVAKGLASYDSPCDKSYVQLLGLTLSEIFCSYLELALNTRVFIDYFSWFENSGIDPVHLEIITGKKTTPDFIDLELQNRYGMADYDCYPDYDSCTTLDEDGTAFYDEIIADISDEDLAEAVKAGIRLQRNQVVSALLEGFGAPGLCLTLALTQLKKSCLEWIEAGMPTQCCPLNSRYFC